MSSHRKAPQGPCCSTTCMKQLNLPPSTTYHEWRKAQNPHRHNPLALWQTQRRTAHLGSPFSAWEDRRQQNLWEVKQPLPPVQSRGDLHRARDQVLVATQAPDLQRPACSGQSLASVLLAISWLISPACSTAVPQYKQTNANVFIYFDQRKPST